MAKPGGVTHLLAEISSLDEVRILLGRSSRLRYTCLSVSRKYLALGSNSGGVYIFSRDTLKYLQVVFGDTEASPVVNVSLSPSDQHVAIALSTGHVVIYELNIDKRAKPERVHYTQDHAGHIVTSLAWDSASSKVFVGDKTGKISVILVPTSKSKNLFTAPSEIIAYVESAVYQMEWLKDKLLVSTVTHTHLFDTIKQNYSTIGTKSRDGEYGACFYVEPSSKYTVIYCARPGSRMWEVDCEGKVLNTHQLKQLLAVPPIPVVKLGSEHFDYSSIPQTGHSVNFYKMFHISQFIITWSSKGLYLFDPINVKVMLWTQHFTGIKDMCIYNNDVYLFLENSSVHRLTLLPIYQLFTVLTSRGMWSLSSSLLLAADQVGMRQAVIKRIKKDLLQNIISGLEDEGKNDIVEKVKASMEDISEGSVDSIDTTIDFMNSAEVKGHTYLPSGMVIVSEGVKVKRKWEKSEVRMTIQDKIEAPGIVEANSLQRGKSIDTEDAEFFRNYNHMNKYKNNEFTEGNTQKESDRYEKIKNSSVYSQENLEENIKISSSGSIDKFDINEEAEKGLDNTLYLQIHHLDTQRSVGDEIVNHSDSKVTSENNLLIDVNNSSQCSETLLTADFSNPAQESETLSLQMYDNGSKISYDGGSPDLMVDNSFDKPDHHSSSINESVMRSSNQNNTDMTSQKGLLVADSGRGLTDVQFEDETFNTKMDINNEEKNVAKMSDDDFRIPNIYQNRTTGLSASSEEIVQSISQSSMHVDEHLAIENDNHFFILPSTQNAVDLGDTINSTESISFVSDAFKKPIQDDSKIHFIGSPSYANNSIFEVDSLATFPEQKIQKSLGNSRENSFADVVPNPYVQIDNTVNKMAALSMDSMNLDRKYPSLKMLQTDNSDIAQPVRVSKKKRTKKSENLTRSVSLDVNSVRTNKADTLRKTASVGDEQDDPFLQGLDLEMDSISIATISSIEEEDVMTSPDSLSAAGDLDVREQLVVRTLSPELSLAPPVSLGKPFSRKSSTISDHEERTPEVIPPLIDRLAAARGTISNEDTLVGLHQDSPSSSPVSVSGEHFVPVGSPMASLSALKDGLSLKLKTQTKSLIKTFKEKNLIKSSVVSPQQLEKSLKNGINHQAQSTEQPSEITALDELSRIKQLATTAANTAALYISALDIKKQLRSSSAIIKPAALKKMLSQWATELLLALFHYHEELLTRTNEMQLDDRKLQTLVSGNAEDDRKLQTLVSGNAEDDRKLQTLVSGNAEETNNGLDSDQLKNERDFVDRESNGVSLEYSSAMTSEENHNITSNTYLALHSGLNSVHTQPVSSKLDRSGHKSLTPSYWANMVHCDDPFQLPTKQLDLFRTLTTMCLVCGVSGDILRQLNFTEEIHYRTFVKTVLPSSLYSLYNPSCECLMSLFPDFDIPSSEPSHHQNSRKNPSGENTEHNPSSVSNDQTTVENGSDNIAEGGDNYNFVAAYENCSSILNSTSVHYETQHQNKSVDEMESKICSCKCNSTIWSKNERFKQDVSTALFIRLFFFALDCEKVKQAIDKQNIRMFIAWTSLVLCSREMGRGDIVSSILADKQVNSAIDYLRSGILPQQSALLGHIYKLFELAPSKTSEFCGEIWKTITPVDLVEFCSLCSKPASSYLLRYFKQVMINLATVTRPKVFSLLCQHRDVRYLLLETLLQPQATDATADGMKSLITQLKAVLPFDWLNILLSLIASEEERIRIVQLCARNGSSTICVKLLTETDQWQSLLRLIVDLNDISLLKGMHSDDGYIPRNEEEWRFLLSYFHEKWLAQKKDAEVENEGHEADSSHQHHFDSNLTTPEHLFKDGSLEGNSSKTEHNITMIIHTESIPTEKTRTNYDSEEVSMQYESFSSEPVQDDAIKDNTITWNSLGYLLLEHVGGATAVSLLIEHLQDPMIVKNCLKSDLLRACYMDFSIKMEQNHVTHDMLEKLSVYMWKKKPDYVPPSVFQAVRTEKRLIESGEGDDVAVQVLFNQVKALESKDLMSEHLGSQWGQEINISSDCQCCYIPLKSVMSLTIPGIIIFPCEIKAKGQWP